eukprot:TRINITY_DN75261_c0_g1_i1.p1 TRINITY_DN75261_c0_g1~~TRINITY_DN75261_c0_g1_i1.p1  ORF type:complete len:320 (+),score=75.52 TRINITY_DN75261_c0_g1_i1:88-1047(+)
MVSHGGYGDGKGKGKGQAAELPHWDSGLFAQKLMQAKAVKDWDAQKRLLAEVAESNYKARHAWNVPRTIPIRYEDCKDHRAKARPETKISFSTMSTADALLHFAAKGEVACGLNFANGEHLGGGYKSGATAQEEDLCRRMPTLYSTLFNANKDGFYPFGPCTCKSPDKPEKYSDVLYTKGVVIARDAEFEGYAWLPHERQRPASLVAAAAPNIRFANEVNDPRLIYQTIETIFKGTIMVDPEVSVLVLGAWGCGAFGGDAEQIAGQFVQAIVQDNLGAPYKEVHFAIPETGPKDSNYAKFRAVFDRFNLDIEDVTSPMH